MILLELLPGEDKGMEQRKIEAWLPAEGGSWWVKFSTAVDVSTSVLAQVPAAVALSREETSCMYSLRSRPTDNIIYLDINDDKYHVSLGN